MVIKLNRVALDLGIFQIYWYSLFILFGIIGAFFVINKEIKKHNISKDLIFDMSFYALIIGIIGARLYYVIFNLDYYLKYPIEILAVYKGGLAIHGGVIAGALFILYYTRKHKLNTLKILDIIVVGLILGQAIGRWGNFLNQEAYGVETTYQALKNIHIPDFIIKGMYIDKTYYTPIFLYESIWNIVGFILLIGIRKIKKLKVGTLSSCYLIWYSLARFFIEGLRTDSLMLYNLKIAQLISVIAIIIGVLLLIYSNKKNDKYHRIERKC